MATTPASPRQNARGRQTRDRLLEAARAVFVERGYSEATMDLIAQRAGTARTTVFNQFATKADLLRAVMVQEGDKFGAALDRDTGDTEARLRAVVRAWGRSIDRDPVASTALVQGWFAVQADGEGTCQAPRSLLVRVLAEGKAAGEVAATVDPVAAGAALFDACAGALARRQSDTSSRRRTAAHQLGTIATMFWRGLATPA